MLFTDVVTEQGQRTKSLDLAWINRSRLFAIQSNEYTTVGKALKPSKVAAEGFLDVWWQRGVPSFGANISASADVFAYLFGRFKGACDVIS